MKECGKSTVDARESHSAVAGKVRRAGYEAVYVTNLTPNMNYSFGCQYFEGFDTDKPPTSAVSASTPAVGTYTPLPLPIIWADIARAALSRGTACAIRYNCFLPN